MEAVRQTLSFSIINILGGASSCSSCSGASVHQASVSPPSPPTASSSCSEETVPANPVTSLSYFDCSTSCDHTEWQQNSTLENAVVDMEARDDCTSTSDSDEAEAELYVVEKLRSKRPGRMRFTPAQIQALEKQFQSQHYLLPADRKFLAKSLCMTERQVKTWFQNKRAQYKRTRPLVRNPVYHYSSSPGPVTLSLPRVHILPLGVNIQQLSGLAGIAGHSATITHLSPTLPPPPPPLPLPPVTLSTLSPHLPMPMAYIPVPITPPK